MTLTFIFMSSVLSVLKISMYNFNNKPKNNNNNNPIKFCYKKLFPKLTYRF